MPRNRVLLHRLAAGKRHIVGAKLMRVFCVGNAAETFSVSTSLSKTWHDVSKWFWEKYMEVGKGIYELPEWKKSEVSGK